MRGEGPVPNRFVCGRCGSTQRKGFACADCGSQVRPLTIPHTWRGMAMWVLAALGGAMLVLAFLGLGLLALLSLPVLALALLLNVAEDRKRDAIARTLAKAATPEPPH